MEVHERKVVVSRKQKLLNLVLWLFALKEKDNMVTYVAKAVSHWFSSALAVELTVRQFPEYSLDDANAQIDRRSFSKHLSAETVQQELDSFLIEAQVFENIGRLCPNAYKACFPQYFGVIRDIDPRKFLKRGYIPRPHAIVLEAIKLVLASRRVLAAEVLSDLASDLAEPLAHFTEKLKELLLAKEVQLTEFELNWYQSLFGDRLRRMLLCTLLGITHGDIRDHHFRLPTDFYDTVLYDFSISYTLSPSGTYLIKFRRPKSLAFIKAREQMHLEELVLER